ncbi:alcohol oxidase [Morchella conica CCBAS932]|uniref:Alcohol oxidase n=2 Tax=Morchella sect. Distantes TaxID=1051054 RepID=A0A3N4KJM3_9PEZI|nr:alcohol oxidase [Morchella conica CCBAS932]
MNIHLSAAYSESYDFIVVGAGTAGGYLAHKLATSPYSPSVLLLENGPNTLSNNTNNPADNPNLKSLIPGNFAENVARPDTNYMYKTVPQKHLDDRVLVYHRGRGLGGTSNLNYMAWIKGYKGDFDEWAEIVGDQNYGSNEGWERIKRLESFDPKGLPKAYEKYASPDMSSHGTMGPIHNTLPTNPLPGMGSFIDGCVEAGIPRALDTNCGQNIGAGLVNMAIYKGARVSSATQCLNEEGDIGTGLIRPRNLEVRTDTKVEKILFDHKTAIGVQVEGGRKFFAKKEVIISAGFIDSPKLLLLSGIGPKADLQELGIKVVHDSPNVGKNMLDHSTVLLDPIFKQDLQVPTGNLLFSEPARVDAEKKLWLDTYQNGKGEARGEMARFGASAGVAFIKFTEEEREQWPEWQALSDEDRSRFLDKGRPDTEIFYLIGYKPPGKDFPEGTSPNSYARLFLLHQNHLARGTISLNSSNPSDAPVIDPQYFSHPYDVRISIETIKKAVEIFKTKALSAHFVGMEFKGCAEDPAWIQDSPEKAEENRLKAEQNGGFYVNGIDMTDKGIEHWLKSKGLDQGYHGMGTLRMGKAGDKMRVVDSKGRVVGVDGLRIADTSVIPVVMNNHPQVSAYLIADVVADGILRDHAASGKRQKRQKIIRRFD